MSRGHKVDLISEIPLVVADAAVNSISKTKEAIKLLKDLHAYDDVEKVKDSRKTRVGVGKSRNRRHVQKKGPLVIHSKELSDHSMLVPAFRNIPGVEMCNVNRLNLLTLAPGGHLGRFVIWTESAFKQLNKIFGTAKTDSKQKAGFRPPRSILTNADIARIINSDEVQSVLNPKKKQHRFHPRKKNPLKNLGAMVKLNPHALISKRHAILRSQHPKKRAKRTTKLVKVKRSKFYQNIHAPAIAPARAAEEGTPTF
jgi:large subunit ribosomal protein L4e